jgi:hypothetical protein
MTGIESIRNTVTCQSANPTAVSELLTESPCINPNHSSGTQLFQYPANAFVVCTLLARCLGFPVILIRIPAAEQPGLALHSGAVTRSGLCPGSGAAKLCVAQRSGATR